MENVIEVRNLTKKFGVFTGSFPVFNFYMGLFLDFVYIILALGVFKIMFEKAREIGLISRLLDYHAGTT